MYADDTQVTAASKTVKELEETLNRDMENLGLSDLQRRRNIQKSILMYKVLNGHAPTYLSDLFVRANESIGYKLRRSETNVRIPQPHTEYLKRSLSYSGAILWNNLPYYIS